MQCPECGSVEIRRSSPDGGGWLVYSRLYAVYRCRSCRTRFSAVNRKSMFYLAIFAVAAVAPLYVFLMYLLAD